MSSDSETSRKRGLDDADDVNGGKRQCLETGGEKDFDQAIAEIVAVIDDESKMLGKYLTVLFSYYNFNLELSGLR